MQFRSVLEQNKASYLPFLVPCERKAEIIALCRVFGQKVVKSAQKIQFRSVLEQNDAQI
jgi:hypothetical protein